MGHCIRNIDPLRGIDMTAAAALIPQIRCHVANQDRIAFRQRKNTILIFQQNRSLPGNPPRQIMMGIPVNFRFYGALTRGNQPQDSFQTSRPSLSQQSNRNSDWL